MVLVVTFTKTDSRTILTGSKWHMIFKQRGNIKKVQKNMHVALKFS